MYGYLIQLNKPFSLWYAIVYKHGINIFHIWEADEFVDGGIVTDITFQLRIGLAPLLGSHAKHGHVEHVSFLSINNARLRRGYFFWYQMSLDGIGMYAIIDFRKFALGSPTNLLLFLGFQALEFHHQIKLKLNRNPVCKLKGDVWAGIGTTIAPCLWDESYGTCCLNPLWWWEGEGIQTCLTSKPLEFEGVKIRII